MFCEQSFYLDVDGISTLWISDFVNDVFEKEDSHVRQNSHLQMLLFNVNISFSKRIPKTEILRFGVTVNSVIRV